jgi:DNA polymerase-3 subunit epsilon
VFFRLDEVGRPRFVRAADVPLDQLPAHYGPFGSRAGVRRFLVDLAREHGLCLKLMKLEGRARSVAADAPCFNYQLKRCAGACVGAETPEAHGGRAADLLAERRVQTWPHAGAIAIVERNADRLRADVHVFDQWCWLGTVRSLDAAHELARNVPPVFEPDTYRIAREALARAASGKLESVELERYVTPPASCAP